MGSVTSRLYLSSCADQHAVFELPTWGAVCRGQIHVGVLAVDNYRHNFEGTVPHLSYYLGSDLESAVELKERMGVSTKFTQIDGDLAVVSSCFPPSVATFSSILSSLVRSLLSNAVAAKFNIETLVLVRSYALSDEGLDQLTSILANEGAPIAKTVDESVAVLYADSLIHDDTHVVVDVGGTSCKYALVKWSSSPIIVTRSSQESCGGLYFRDRLMAHLIDRYHKITHSRLDFDMQALHDLALKAERAMMELASQPRAIVNLTFDHFPEAVDLELTREVFQALIAEEIELSAQVVRELAEQAIRQGLRVASVRLAGGAAYSAALHPMLSRGLHPLPLIQIPEPSTASLRGAIVMASRPAGPVLAAALYVLTDHGAVLLAPQATPLPLSVRFRLARARWWDYRATLTIVQQVGELEQTVSILPIRSTVFDLNSSFHAVRIGASSTGEVEGWFDDLQFRGTLLVQSFV